MTKIRHCHILTPSMLSGWDRYIYDVIAERNARQGIATRMTVGDFASMPTIGQFQAMTADEPVGSSYIFTINRTLDTCHILYKQPRLLTQVDCPVISYVVDNIGYYAGTVSELPIARERRVVADANCAEILEKLAPALPAPDFFPMWGLPRSGPALPSMGERDLDLLFIGNVTPLAESEHQVREMARGHAGLVDFMRECAQILVATRGNQDPAVMTLYQMVTKSMLQRYPIDVPWFSEIFRAVDGMARALHRNALLRRFASVPLTIVGTGAEAIAAERPNVRALGAIPLAEAVGLCRRAKLVLGDLAGFTGGVELRPSLAMANGAVYFGETNAYLSRTVPADCRLEGGDDPDAMAAAAIADPAGLDAMAGRAGLVYDRLVQDSTLPFLETLA